LLLYGCESSRAKDADGGGGGGGRRTRSPVFYRGAPRGVPPGFSRLSPRYFPSTDACTHLLFSGRHRGGSSWFYGVRRIYGLRCLSARNTAEYGSAPFPRAGPSRRPLEALRFSRSAAEGAGAYRVFARSNGVVRAESLSASLLAGVGTIVLIFSFDRLIEKKSRSVCSAGGKRPTASKK